jgi:hypothetical protein
MNALSEPPSRLSPRQPLLLFPLKHPVFLLLTLSRSPDRALPCPAF